MPYLHETSVQANLRSSPTDANPGNILVSLPSGHWVNIIGVETSSWLNVWTIYKNKQFEGYMGTSVLRKRYPLTKADDLDPWQTMRHQYFAEPESASLKSFLTISPPSINARPAEALTIARSREVQFDWSLIFSSSLLNRYFGGNNIQPFATTANIRYFLDYFLRIWGLNQSNYAQETATPQQASRIFELMDVKLPAIREKTPVVIGLPRFEYVYEDLQGQWVLKHPLSGRLFLIRALDSANPIVASDFADWAAFWQLFLNKVREVTHVVEHTSTIGAQKLVSEVEEVDLAPAIVLRQYSELASVKEFTESLDKQATELGKQGIQNLLSDQEIDGLISGVLRMKAPEVERRVGLERLVDRSSDLGYLLNVSDQAKKYKYEDGSELNLDPGKLYQPYITRIYWTTEHKRSREWSNPGFFGFGGSSGRSEWVEVIRHEKDVIKYREEPVDFDPWNERQSELLRKEGLRSFRFEKQGQNYRTSQGENLADVMSRCDRDESFRQQTAVWLPVYEQRLTRGEILTRYVIFKRPYLGIRPTRLPRLYVEENLTYRTQWRSSELGELVHTINLAPGEERTVTVDQKTSKQIEETRSTTSILDLTESDSLELSTEIEKEAKSSTESSRSSSWSAAASGSYGPIGGSASASGDSKTTTMQFARNMERIARKAAHNLTRKTQQEVKSSTTIRADFTRSESTSIKIKNINEGRTLNLLFFRLYNLYTAGVFVDDLKLLVESGVEIVAGSGVTVPRLYDLPDLSSAFSSFDIPILPFPIAEPVGTEAYARAFNAYWSYILDEFVKLLGTEYQVDVGVQSGILDFDVTLKADFSARANIAPARPRLDFAGDYSNANLYAALQKEIKKLEAALTKTVAESSSGKEPLIPQELRVASPGLYLDTFMGVRPATEPYAEEMRAQQVRMRSAEAAKQQALANYYNSLAQVPPGGVPARRAMARAAVQSDRSISVDFFGIAPAGNWQMEVDGQVVKQISVQDGQTNLLIEFDEPPLWLSDLDNHSYRLVAPDDSVIHFAVSPGTV